MLEAFALSDPGCVRNNNEDFYFIDSSLGLYLLADGMGGAQAGETASRLAIETAVECIKAKPERNRDALVEAFHQANQRVRARAATDVELNGMGTTLVGVLECGEEVAIASVGDSRAYLFEKGTLSRITEDQTWANEVGRRLGIGGEQLKHHPMRHVLTMAIGVDTPLRIHTYQLRPEPGMHFLLCSDGLHGVVPLENIAEALNSLQTLAAQTNYLIEAAKLAGGPDNITVVLLKVN